MSEMWQKKAVEAFEKLQVQRSPIFVEADVYSVLLVSLSIAISLTYYSSVKTTVLSRSVLVRTGN
jgi:hypothetical protein